MSRRIVLGLRVLPHIPIAIHAPGIGLGRIGPHKLPHHRVIVPEPVIEQPRLTIQALPRVVVGGGYRALAVTHRAIGRVELHRLHATSTGQHQARPAQAVVEQVVQRGTRAHPYSLAAHVVVLRRGRGAVVQDDLQGTVEGDGIGDALTSLFLAGILLCIHTTEQVKDSDRAPVPLSQKK